MTLYTDIDPYCCEVIRARIADGSLPPGEVWCRDVTTLTDDELRAFDQVHLFCGIGGSPLGRPKRTYHCDLDIRRLAKAAVSTHQVACLRNHHKA